MVENLGLEKTKIKVDKGRIETNGYMETAEANIFAIGDMAGAPWLAHKASFKFKINKSKNSFSDS